MSITLRADPFGDKCCREVLWNGEYLGHWCSKSHILAIDGEVAGSFSSEDDLKQNLAQREVTVSVWGRK